MRIGDLIAYAHDREKVGIIIKVSPERGEDDLLVLWNTPSKDGKQQWYVSAEWCVMVRSASNANMPTL